MSNRQQLAEHATGFCLTAIGLASGDLAVSGAVVGAVALDAYAGCVDRGAKRAAERALNVLAEQVPEALEADVTTALHLLRETRLRIDPEALARAIAHEDAPAQVLRATFGAVYDDHDPGVKAALAAAVGAALQSVRLDETFDRVFVQDMVINLLRGQGVVVAKLEEIHRLLDDMRITQAEREHLKADLARVQADLGATERLIGGFVRSIVGREVRPEDFAATLFEMARDWKDAGERISALEVSHNLSPRLAGLKAEAQAAYEAEDTDRAWTLLSEIEAEETATFERLDEERRAIEQAQAEYRKRLIATKAAKLSIAASRLDAEMTVALELETWRLDGGGFWALHDVWQGWYERGRDKGLAFDLDVSIALARASHDAAREPDEAGAALNNLGNALSTLGERKSGTALLEEAVAAYRAALTERTRDRVPRDWARTQNNLGNALATLGERESWTARLQEAVAAYRAALEELTQDQVPLDWATAQMNLGNALRAIGERESGTVRLGEAVAAYRAALQEVTRDRVPLNWAAMQNNLGNALWTLGTRESGPVRLEEAVSAYREALEERTRDRVPMDWAFTTENVGLVHESFFDKTGDAAHLDEAERHVRAAREVYDEAGATYYIEKSDRILRGLAEKRGAA